MHQRRVILNSKLRAKVNRQNARGRPWENIDGTEIDHDHIVKCWDMYKRGQITSRQLLEHFPGRTIKAIESKVWKIRGRAEPGQYANPNQGDLFRGMIRERGRDENCQDD